LFFIKITGDLKTKIKYGMKPDSKFVDSMKLFAESYAKSTDTFFCSDMEVTESVIQGLANNKEKFGAPLCPCRYYDNKEDEISLAYWNCPCVPMRERKECHCMLFLTSDNEFSSPNQSFNEN
jgi:ferredoxin-thioredoxin reductase catalytic chain